MDKHEREAWAHYRPQQRLNLSNPAINCHHQVDLELVGEVIRDRRLARTCWGRGRLEKYLRELFFERKDRPGWLGWFDHDHGSSLWTCGGGEWRD